MNIGQQIADARMAGGGDRLFAARLPAGYNAGWQYGFAKVTATELADGLGENTSSSFDIAISGNAFTAEANGAANYFELITNNYPISTGNGLRVRLVADFDPSPLSGAGQLTVALINSGGDVLVESINADGVIDFTYISPANEIYYVAIRGGMGSADPADWTTGDAVAATLSITTFPPAINQIEFPLNPAIPWQKLVLGIPDASYSCLARIEFQNGSAVQSVAEVALGIVPGRFIVNPPTRPIQAGMFFPDFPNQYLFENQKIIDNETGDTVSLNCCGFEWSGIYDKVVVSFSNFSASVNVGITPFAGILQLPQT